MLSEDRLNSLIEKVDNIEKEEDTSGLGALLSHESEISRNRTLISGPGTARLFSGNTKGRLCRVRFVKMVGAGMFGRSGGVGGDGPEGKSSNRR